jgi:predicted dienelactone hydrolase
MCRSRLPALALTLVVAAGCAAPRSRAVTVGRLHRSYTDPARRDWTDQGPRPLEATVWYPAARGSPEVEWKAGAFRLGRGAPRAPFADTARRPLIVLSHGTGGSAAQLSWLAEELVAAGYVVAGVDHHGNTATEERYRPQGFVLPWERARDLSVLIDRLFADSAVGPHIDTTRVGAAGFSLGGYSVLALAGAHLNFVEWQQQCAATPDIPACVLPPEASFTRADLDSIARTDSQFRASVARGRQPTRDGRIGAVFAMAPALVPVLDSASLAAIRVPLLVVMGEEDTQVVPGPTRAILTRFVPGVTVELLPGVGHYAFLAPCAWRGRVTMPGLCADGGRARVATHQRVAADAVRFFGTWLAPGAPLQ